MLLREGFTPGAVVETLSSQFPGEVIAGNIKFLHQAGLFSNPKDTPFTTPTNPPLDTLDLQVSHKCNLGCKYCYAEGGNFGVQEKMMSCETAREIIDFFVDQTDGSQKLCVSFDGGEPLMNFPVMQDVAHYCKEQETIRDRRFHFNIGTNATIMDDEIADFFSEYNLNPQVSIDGNKSIQDLLRPYKNGKSSYQSMMDGIKMLKDRGVRIAVRITITPENLQLSETVKLLHELGVIRIAAFPASGIPGEFAFRPGDLDTLKREYDKTAQFFLDTLFETGRFVCLSNFTDNLKLLHNAKILHYACGAARTFVSADPHGDIYPCHRMVGNHQMRLGNIKNGIDRDKQRELLENHVDSKESCRSCWARYQCGGGCTVEALFTNGDIKTPYDVSCEIYKYEKELSMMIYSEITNRDKSLLEGFEE